MALLDIRDLSINVGHKPVVQNISFSLDRGQTFGIVGESGCGKSLTSLAIMGLLEGTKINISGGDISFDELDLITMKPADRRRIMGNRMAMIFQEPMTCLNPVYRVGDQIVEAIRQHDRVSAQAAKARVVELLKRVRIPDPEGRFRSYPHQLSGGMRQRVMIAMALACDPDFLIADEPTTALDVTVQAQILDLLRDLQSQTGMGMILISHDLGVIAENCQSVAVMYRGRIVESSSGKQLFTEPRHPYTRALMASIPDADKDVDMLDAIKGRVPTIHETIPGCAFHPRCGKADDKCMHGVPPISRDGEHLVMCHHPQGGSAYAS